MNAVATATQNVTIKIPRTALRKARMTAARLDTSVSALVAEYLEKLEDPADTVLERSLQDEFLKLSKKIRGNIRAMRRDIRKAIAAVDRSTRRA